MIVLEQKYYVCHKAIMSIHLTTLGKLFIDQLMPYVINKKCHMLFFTFIMGQNNLDIKSVKN